MEEYSTTWLATDYILVHALCMLAKTHTLCRLSMAKMVTWTRLVVPFIRTLPVIFNVKLRRRREEKSRYIFYYPFQIFVLFFNLLLSLVQWRRSWVFSGNSLVVYRIKNHKIQENGSLGIHCRRRLGSLKISYISFPLPLGFQIANTGIVLLHFCSYFSLPMPFTFHDCYTMTCYTIY